jgi:hypothetical protein
VHFFPSGDSPAMARAMLDVINDPSLRESLVARGYEYVERNGWGRKKKEYLDLIDSLSAESFEAAGPATSELLRFQRIRNRDLSAIPAASHVAVPGTEQHEAAPASLAEEQLIRQQIQ